MQFRVKYMDISNRLLQIVDYVNITANAFAAKIGVSQPRFRNYLNGRAPDYDTLSQICKTFVMINERWLLTGEGEMLKKSTNDSLAATSVVYKSDPRDAEILAANKETIETQKKLIMSLEQRIRELERGSSLSKNSGFIAAQSVDTTTPSQTGAKAKRQNK